MPPMEISSAVEEDLEEIKKSLHFMSEELSSVAKQQAKLLELMGEVSILRRLGKE